MKFNTVSEVFDMSMSYLKPLNYFDLMLGLHISKSSPAESLENRKIIHFSFRNLGIAISMWVEWCVIDSSSGFSWQILSRCIPPVFLPLESAPKCKVNDFAHFVSSTMRATRVSSRDVSIDYGLASLTVMRKLCHHPPRSCLYPCGPNSIELLPK